MVKLLIRACFDLWTVTDSLHENNPDKEFDELRFAVDDGTNILIIINKGEITGAVDIDNIPVC